MLFDLKGKRKRTVQVTYLGLAILMGAGLVLFGIGSSVNGGLGDLFKGGNGSNKANETIQKKIDAAQKTLQRDPKNQPALIAVTKGHYQLATANADANTSEFTAKSRPDLVAATQSWKRYEGIAKKPDASLTQTMIQAYDGLANLETETAKAQAWWKGAADAAELHAANLNKAQAYIVLVQFATLAGEDRKATLAASKAIALAPKSQKKAAKQAVAQAKTTAQQALTQLQQKQSGGQGAAQPTPSG
jgi:hypothetical protein